MNRHLPALGCALALFAGMGCSAIISPDPGRLGAGPDGGAQPCAEPGATEQVACGFCGTTQRSCTADGIWSYGPCIGAGECAPGTTGTVACGSCGEQTARCTESCTYQVTGSCSGEGECAPGTTTRSGSDCPAGQTQEIVCSDACVYEPASACMLDTCSTPGATETVSCGDCGTQQRFCSSAGVWEYGPCGEGGECRPGTTGVIACGMCGEQTARCTASCEWLGSGECEGEGVCAPGDTQQTSVGCPAGQTRTVACDDACTYSIEVSPCSASTAVDVIFLLDTTGSNRLALDEDLPTLTTRCIEPLLSLRGVHVGVSYTGDFPISPYGETGDRPFEGGIEPTASLAVITAELTLRPSYAGADGQDAAVEALSTLTGGPVSPYSIPLTCTGGRTPGGCWRSGARRAIVIHTDSPIHNGPDPATSGLLAPYTGISPAPAEWPTVRSQMTSTATLLQWIDTGGIAPASDQFNEMLVDLGQPTSDRHEAFSAAAVGPACDAIVARIRASAGL